MMLLTKLYAQFQPSSALEVVAVVDAYKKTPVRVVESARAPLRPKRGSSMRKPPRIQPGMPRTEMMTSLR